jgi:hypothetical protein
MNIWIAEMEYLYSLALYHGVCSIMLKVSIFAVRLVTRINQFDGETKAKLQFKLDDPYLLYPIPVTKIVNNHLET